MNNLTEKLIKDGNETKRAKINLISISIGGILLCIGIACIFLKAVSVEYIDAQGILHENFFLNQRDIFQHVPITSRKPVKPDSKGFPGFFAFWGSSRILANPGAS